MAEKRKMSTRSGGELPPKKRVSSLSPSPSPVKHIDEGLPTRLRDGEELPTLPVQQDKNLDDALYQSIAERSVQLIPSTSAAD